jgi:putative ATP-binding cassette transporter
MKLLAIVVGIFSAAAAVIAQTTGETGIFVLAAAGFVCTVTTYRAQTISSFLKIFAAIFAIETVLFGSLYLLAKVGFWPASLADYQLPESLPLTVAMFAITVYGVSFVPVVRAMMNIADRYFAANDGTVARVWPFPAFSSLERRVAIAMVVFLVVVNQAQVGINVRISFINRDLFNAIQDKNEAAFWYQFAIVFIPWAAVYIVSSVAEFVVQSTLVIRWRRWLTDHYIKRWLNDNTHYRMSLIGSGADNPDQRISEDVNRFIDGGHVGYGLYSFSILLISKLSSLVSFAIILWNLSIDFTLPYTNIALPGLLFWVALIYAGIGTLLTHLIGRPLARLSFTRQRYEADFRFSLARLREYSEQIALLRGEAAENASLNRRFASIIKNYFEIVACRKQLTAFTNSYAQISPFIPFIVAAPFYFAGKIQLGIMTQTARAFSSVDDSLTFFVTYYVSLAEFKAVLDRLSSFDAAIEKARGLNMEPTRKETAKDRPGEIDLDKLTLRLPDGHDIVKGANVRLFGAQPALFTGPSGSGKSTLFRAVAGIWPFGEGLIEVPRGAHVMLLPQKPYIPIGTLRGAITYPATPDKFGDAALRDALETALLGGFVDKLDVEDIWSQRLSGGEQQRLSIARALLAKPDWLFLDEATAAMDETMEGEIYKVLSERLPKTTIVSIGHRTTLEQFHKRRLEMHPIAPGVFTPLERPAEAAE